MIIKHSRFPNFLPINNYIVARGSFRHKEEEQVREKRWRERQKKEKGRGRDNGKNSSKAKHSKGEVGEKC